MKILTR